MKNIFLEKSFTKCGGETRLRTFFKILKLSISLDQQSEDSYSFHFLSKSKTTKTYWNYVPNHLLLLDIRLFEKQKQIWNKFPCLIFCMIFEIKYLHCIDRPNFIVWLPLFVQVSGNMFLVIVCVLACAVIN